METVNAVVDDYYVQSISFPENLYHLNVSVLLDFSIQWIILLQH